MLFQSSVNKQEICELMSVEVGGQGLTFKYCGMNTGFRKVHSSIITCSTSTDPRARDLIGNIFALL